MANTSDSSSPASAPSILLIALIAMISPIAMNAFNPAMPDVVKVFDSDISTVQLTYTLYLGMLAFSQLIGGPLAERFGRRPLMIWGLAFHLLGSLIALLAGSVEQIIVGRALQAFGGGFALMLCRTIVVDSFQGSQAAKGLSHIVMAVALAQSLSPTIGGYLNHYYGWETVFVFSFAISLVISALAVWKLPETSTHKSGSLHPFAVIKQYRELVQCRNYMAYTLTTVFAAGAYFTFASAMPYVVVDVMDGTSAIYGEWFLWVSGGFFLGSLAVTRLPSSTGIDGPIKAGLALSLLGAGVMIASSETIGLQYAWIFLPMAIVTFGRGLVQPNAQTAGVNSVPHKKSTATGFMGFTQLLVGTLISQLTPVLLKLGVTAVFGFILFCVVASYTSHQQVDKNRRTT